MAAPVDGREDGVVEVVDESRPPSWEMRKCMRARVNTDDVIASPKPSEVGGEAVAIDVPVNDTICGERCPSRTDTPTADEDLVHFWHTR